MKRRKSEATITRLVAYLRYLSEMDRAGTSTTVSENLAKKLDVSPAIVRKDLDAFGQFGTRGVGYDVKDLYQQILRILKLNVVWNTTLVGLGSPEIAFWLCKDLWQQGFILTSIFDVDPNKIGTVVGKLKVRPIDRLEETIRKDKTEIAILAVPSETAQDTADILVKGGIRAILNFAQVPLQVPPDIGLYNMDLFVGLGMLSFNCQHRCTGSLTLRMESAKENDLLL